MGRLPVDLTTKRSGCGILRTGKVLQTLEGHTNWVYALAALGDGMLASGSWDKTIRLWDLRTGKVLQTLKAHTTSVSALGALGDGTLASGSWDKTIRLWDLRTGKVLRT